LPAGLQSTSNSPRTCLPLAIGPDPLHGLLALLGRDAKTRQISLLPGDELRLCVHPPLGAPHTPLANTAVTVKDHLCARHIPIVSQYLVYDQSV
jgi:hypothetical protein